jgi:hypothetical protein
MFIALDVAPALKVAGTLMNASLVAAAGFTVSSWVPGVQAAPPAQFVDEAVIWTVPGAVAFSS